jgi:type II secretory ATPase GspE/PulE/Tfp pilus assembly ATPase PilB-like protein
MFGKKKKEARKQAAEEEEEEEIDQVLFQGPLFEREADLKKNPKLVQAGLIPVKQMITDALSRRSHTIMLEPRDGRVAIRFVVDGIPYPAGAVPGQRGSAMIQMLKLLAGLDTTNRKDAQDGGIKAEFDGRVYHLMIDSVPQKRGERVRIKVQDTKVVYRRPADVGFPEHLRQKLREYTADRSGVILVCGPPESGVTTLSIVALHTVDPYLYVVFNMAVLKGQELINVTDFEPEEGHDLETSFERLSRREADVLFMPPLTVPQDTQAIFDFSDRLSFIAEISANTPAEALKKLIEWVGVDAVLKGLRGILTLKMIRKLCDPCKQAFRPNPQLLKRLGLPPETSVLYRAPSPPPPDDPEGQTIEELCADCDGSPYHGRVAAFELLEITDGMKEVIVNGADAAEIRKQMTLDEMTTLQKDALRLVVEGKTSLEEVQRSFAPPGGRKGGAKKKRPGPGK